jgi:hypothetical protein
MCFSTCFFMLQTCIVHVAFDVFLKCILRVFELFRTYVVNVQP